MSSLINKAKEKIEQTLDKNSNNNKVDNPHSSNAGPHSSNLMNKTDPRIDSDRDHRNDPASRVGGVGNTQEYNTIHGQTTAPGVSHNVGGIEPTYGTGPGNVGDQPPLTTGQSVGHTGHAGGLPGHTTEHSHGHHGHHGHGPHTGHTGGLHEQGVGHTGPTGDYAGHGAGQTIPVGGAAAGGYGGAPNTYDNPQSVNTGPHRSNLANKIDPRVDSDNDNRNDPTSRVGGYGTQGENYGHSYGGNTGVPGTHGGVGATGGAGTYGGVGTHDNVGTHGGVGTTGGYGPGAPTGDVGSYGHSSATPGSGNARNTAGPHNSDMLNKLDPRVDADLDGSKTYGGNATYR